MVNPNLFKKKILFLIALLLSFQMLQSPAYSQICNCEKNPYHISDTNSDTEINKSIPSLVFIGVGSVIALSAIIMVIFFEPESIGFNTETFIIKNNLIKEDSQVISLANLFGLNYSFGHIFELSPAIVFIPQNSNLFLTDFGVKFSDNRVINGERHGISPFISAGLSGGFSNSSFGYGIYAKTGLLLKLENILVNFDVGYRLLQVSNISVNSFTVGGNISYKFQ
ncbi:MAG: hypothetical protein H7263_05465 [Candidatus Sericytochromatia bacterium]|nr:hypothetical protein [Candidatus Sericytochromatia bacterium]